MDQRTSSPAAGLTRTVELTSGLRFAPLPRLMEGPASGWRSLDELDRTAGTSDPYSVSAALAAELDDCPAGPHAVHTLRSLTRELIWSQSASILLTGQGAAFTAEQWMVAGVGAGPGSIRHGLLSEAAGPVQPWAAADTVVAVVTPLVEAIREQTRVGRRTLWSYVVDTATLAMVVLARQLGRDRVADWQVAQEWAGQLFAAGVPELSRPQLVRYGDSDRDIWAVRGACCLDFKDPHHGFCLTCPVLDHGDRARRWAVSDLATPPPSAAR